MRTIWVLFLACAFGQGLDPRLECAPPHDHVGERHLLRLGIELGRGEAADFGDPLTVGRILTDALLEHATKLAPELGELLFIVLCEFFDHAARLLAQQIKPEPLPQDRFLLGQPSNNVASTNGYFTVPMPR